MIRFAPGLFGLVLMAFWIWAVLDVIATERILIRNLEKTVWLFLVIFLPSVGGVAWLLLGRPANAGFSPGSTAVRTPPPSTYRRPAPLGIEDSLSWQTDTTRSEPVETGRESSAAKERRLLEWEAELKKRENELDDNSEQ